MTTDNLELEGCRQDRKVIVLKQKALRVLARAVQEKVWRRCASPGKLQVVFDFLFYELSGYGTGEYNRLGGNRVWLKRTEKGHQARNLQWKSPWNAGLQRHGLWKHQK